MAHVLGINAVFHDSSAALVENGVVTAALEEERISRRKHGKECVPFTAWELPSQAARWCLSSRGIDPASLDAVAYSYEPSLATPFTGEVGGDWEGLRTLYAKRAPQFLNAAIPGLEHVRFEHVPHHVAHAASAFLAAPFENSAVLVLDGRGERASALFGRWDGRTLETLATVALPNSLGLLYEELTVHLGFHRSSDEYKVMGLAAHGTPRFLDDMRALVTVHAPQFETPAVDFTQFAPKCPPGGPLDERHADLAASVQVRLEEALLELVRWLHCKTGERNLCMAGGVALNCVANARIAAEGPFERVWVQPAAGDAGTSLGAALWVAHALGDRVRPMSTAALGRAWSDQEIAEYLRHAHIPLERCDDVASEVAQVIARDGIVAWFQGRSEFGPRALGHRSLLANPRYPRNLERLNDVKGREAFRPVAPMVLAERAGDIFEGQLPSPYMLFTHRVRDGWHDRIAAAVHVDGTARIQTVDRRDEPLVARMLDRVDELTGTPVVINTSLNTAGRPMVDEPRDALECFGSAPVDLLAMGSFVVRREALYGRKPVREAAWAS